VPLNNIMKVLHRQQYDRHHTQHRHNLRTAQTSDPTTHQKTTASGNHTNSGKHDG
jgi:hypothetical protein